MNSIKKDIRGKLLVLLFLAVGMLLVPAEARAQAVKVRYGGADHTYYKTIETVYVNGKKIDLTGKPIYLKSGCYIGPANIIF